MRPGRLVSCGGDPRRQELCCPGRGARTAHGLACEFPASLNSVHSAGSSARTRAAGPGSPPPKHLEAMVQPCREQAPASRTDVLLSGRHWRPWLCQMVSLENGSLVLWPVPKCARPDRAAVAGGGCCRCLCSALAWAGFSWRCISPWLWWCRTCVSAWDRPAAAGLS